MVFNYKKNVLLMASILIGLPLFLLFLSVALYLTHNPLYAEANYVNANTLTLQHYHYNNRDISKKNIFFTAGSNSFIGIHTPTLQKQLMDYNIFNFSTTVQLPLSFKFNILKYYAKAGDIIIAPLEYAHITAPEIEYHYEFNFQQFTTWAIKYIPILSQELQDKINKQAILTHWKRLANLGQKLPILTEDELVRDYVYKGVNFDFNQYGECLVHPSKNSTERPDNKFAIKIPTSSEQSAINIMKEFATYCTKHSIQIYFTYPVSLKTSTFDTNIKEVKKSMQLYASFFTENGLNFFGTPEFYNFEKKYMFDSPYHPTAVGAVIRSKLLAEDINTYIFNHDPSYEKGFVNDFFNLKVKEAEQYIDNLLSETP